MPPEAMIDNWPAAMRQLLATFSTASSPGTALSLACLFPESPGVTPAMAKHAFFATLPIAALAAVASWKAARRAFAGGEGAAEAAQRTVAILVVVLFMLIMSIAQVRRTSRRPLARPFARACVGVCGCVCVRVWGRV